MVAIKDMEMPKHCMTCQYHDPLYDRCHIGHFDTGAKYIKGDDKWYFKHSECPLVEIITCKDCNQVNCSYHVQTCDPEEYRPNFYCADAIRRG